MTTQALHVTRRGKALERPRRIPERVILGAVGLLVVLVAWQGAVNAGLIKTAVWASPLTILNAANRDIGSGAIWPHMLVSGEEYVLGMLLALAVGIPIGLAIGLSWRVNYLLDPWLSALYSTPIVALVPLIILIFGVDMAHTIAVVFLEAWIVITVSVIYGVQATEARFHEIAVSFRAKPWMRFATVILPSTVPFMITGARLGVGRGVVGVIVGELLAGNQGLGFYIGLNGSINQSARAYFGIVLLGFLGLIMGELVRRLERRFDRWRPQIH
jgi:ABC-type nitrate/sulfonate/bicarbonate transport system permease component